MLPSKSESLYVLENHRLKIGKYNETMWFSTFAAHTIHKTTAISWIASDWSLPKFESTCYVVSLYIFIHISMRTRCRIQCITFKFQVLRKMNEVSIWSWVENVENHSNAMMFTTCVDLFAILPFTQFNNTESTSDLKRISNHRNIFNAYV